MIFILIFLMIDGVEHLFDVLIGHLWKNVHSDTLPNLFNWVVWFFKVQF